MRFFLSLMLLVSVLALVGCGGGSAVTPETTTDSVTEIIKPLLERLAETGDLQGAEEVKSYIEEDLAGVDEAKSAALMKDWQEMQSMTDTAAIKAKAQEMLTKL
jgi:hypothetical protein